MGTKEIMELIEANRLMADIIDKLALALLEHISADDFNRIGIINEAKKAAGIMKDYE